MFLKRKVTGEIKAKGCADGKPQQATTPKKDKLATTVGTESLFLVSTVNAHEKREVATTDIGGAFMQANAKGSTILKLEGKLAEMLAKLDPKMYRKYITYENVKPVLYSELKKALYGTVMAAKLFQDTLISKLVDDMGFELNPYDECVANKVINGKQCTILYHVDDQCT